MYKRQLSTNTQYKYDKLAADTAQKDVENKLKQQGFTASQAEKAAKQLLANNKFQLDVDKFNWKKAQPPASNSSADLAAAIAAMMSGR